MSFFKRTAVCALAALATCQAQTQVDLRTQSQEHRFFGRQLNETVADGHAFARDWHRGPNVPAYERNPARTGMFARRLMSGRY